MLTLLLKSFKDGCHMIVKHMGKEFPLGKMILTQMKKMVRDNLEYLQVRGNPAVFTCQESWLAHLHRLVAVACQLVSFLPYHRLKNIAVKSRKYVCGDENDVVEVEMLLEINSTLNKLATLRLSFLSVYKDI